MTLADIEKRVTEVRRAIDEDDDNVRAHIIEDDLWRGVLKAIASSTDTTSAEMARAALETLGIEFTRWHS